MRNMETLVLEKSAYEIERNKPMPNLLHARCQSRLNTEICKKYDSSYEVLSELTLRLPQSTQDYVPDLSIYPINSFVSGNDETQVSIAPLCAIEIISPSQSINEMVEKIKAYFQLGVQSAWLVLPTFENIYVYSSPTEYEIYRAHQTLIDTKTNIEIELSKIFR
jgi:Uma2 family endonuclease